MECVDKLMQAILEGDDEIAVEAAKEIVEKVDDLKPVIAKMTEAMRILGKQFEQFEIFLPEMMVSSDAMIAALEVLEPKLLATGQSVKKGTVVMGGAPGDMHEIGKNIVVTVLKADGFNVVDLGKNVPVMDYVNKSREVNADIIGISALMTTTMPGIKDVIDLLKDKGERANYKIMVGGAPTNAKWAEQIGADGWSESASDAVVLANKLMGVE